MKDFSGLLDAAKRGDPESLAELHRRCAQPLLARLRHQLGPLLRRTYDTLDLGQSLFLDILEDLQRFRNGGESEFRGWLYRRAQNKIRLQLRRKLDRRGEIRERPLLPLDGQSLSEEAPGPATLAGFSDDVTRLTRLLPTLDKEHREILRLRGQRGFSYRVISERLRLSPDAARMRYARALLALQARWAIEDRPIARGPKRR